MIHISKGSEVGRGWLWLAVALGRDVVAGMLGHMPEVPFQTSKTLKNLSTRESYKLRLYTLLIHSFTHSVGLLFTHSTNSLSPTLG